MLSVVLPTYNEALNIEPLIGKVQQVLSGIPHEIIVVDDDSPDGTWKIAEKIPGVRVLRRIGRRGLSSAVVEGWQMAKGDVLAVMDADGQHDTTLLAALYKEVKNGAGVAMGSRYTAGGSIGQWGGVRKWMSRAGTKAALWLCRLTVTDPMSGFFALDANVFKRIQHTLNPQGFKILLEVLVAVPRSTKIVEVPFVFGLRTAGESKLSAQVQLQFISQLVRLTLRRASALLTVLFVFILLCVGSILFLQAWDLRLLYTDAAIRPKVQATVEAVAAKNGWLLSDIELQSVDEQGIEFIHQPHIRTPLEGECYGVSYTSTELQPCES